MAQSLALVVDDEPDIRELVALTLSRMDVRVDTAASVAEAKRRLAGAEYDLCFTDMQLGDGSGLDLVRHIQKQCPQTPVAVMRTSTSPAAVKPPTSSRQGSGPMPASRSASWWPRTRQYGASKRISSSGLPPT